MASPNFYFPPSSHFRPPPPSPSPDNHTTVMVIVFMSCGGLLILAFIAAAISCYIKKKRKKAVQGTDPVHVDEHLKVKEGNLPGPHGPQAVMLEIEDDVHFDEVIKKNKNFGEGFHLHANNKSADQSNNPSSGVLQKGETSSGSDHYHDHHQSEHKG